MKHLALLISLVALAALAFAQSAPVVSNVTAVQRTDGSKMIDIGYDLYDADQNYCDVYIRISPNGGQSYDIIPTLGFLSGDIGPGIAPGTGKHVVWDATGEGYRLDGDNYIFKVTADDSSSITMPPNFIFVQGGTFQWGSSNVTVSSFWMDKHEVSQGEWLAVMKVNPSQGFGEGTFYPVYRINWFSAIEYCNRRSLRDGREPCYSYDDYGSNPYYWPQGWNTDWYNHTLVSCNWNANGYRLLSDMEWRFAAKGGIHSQGFTYSGSNDLDTVAWYALNSGNATHPVGSKAANEIGAHDMTGNVWEWTWDIWDTSYSPGNVTDPHGPLYGNYRLTNGGSYNTAVQYCPISWYNCGGHATDLYWNVGLRVCCNDPDTQPPGISPLWESQDAIQPGWNSFPGPDPF